MVSVVTTGVPHTHTFHKFTLHLLDFTEDLHLYLFSLARKKPKENFYFYQKMVKVENSMQYLVCS